MLTHRCQSARQRVSRHLSIEFFRLPSLFVRVRKWSIRIRLSLASTVWSSARRSCISCLHCTKKTLFLLSCSAPDRQQLEILWCLVCRCWLRLQKVYGQNPAISPLPSQCYQLTSWTNRSLSVTSSYHSPMHGLLLSLWSIRDNYLCPLNDAVSLQCYLLHTKTNS